jgi:hypothetical protein
MPDIRSELGRTIRETAIEHFVTDTPAPTARFSRACGLRDIGGRSKVNVYFDNLVRQGVLTLQATGNGNGKTPHVFNWTSRPLETITLADAARAYFDAEDVENTAKQNVRVALRFLFDLGAKCSNEQILAAAEAIGALDIRTVPEQVYRRALKSKFTKPKRTAAQYRSYIRTLIRFAAENDVIPIVHTPNWAEDPFTEAALKYFPREEDISEDHPISSSAVRVNLRSAYKRYAEAVIDLYGAEAAEFADAADATDEVVAKVCEYWIRKGRKANRDRVVQLFGRLGRTFGVGPRAAAAKVDEIPHTLDARQGRISTGSEGIRNVLEDHGLTASWGEPWDWMEIWFTADQDTLHRKGFPDRFASHQIGPGALELRIYSLRVLLGVAKHWLGWEGEKLAPEYILGEGYRELLYKVFDVWAKRAEVGLVSARFTSGLKSIVVHSGLCALALFHREAHLAGVAVNFGLNDPVRTRAELRNVRRQQDAMYKNARQDAYWNAYRWSMNRDSLITTEMGGAPGVALPTPTVKDKLYRTRFPGQVAVLNQAAFRVSSERTSTGVL